MIKLHNINLVELYEQLYGQDGFIKDFDNKKKQVTIQLPVNSTEPTEEKKQKENKNINLNVKENGHKI